VITDHKPPIGCLRRADHAIAASDADRLRREVRHVVLHEIAHHFGISDERLIELDRD
jgi:predicted Zn-dependent protease with MMP-like domain